MWFEKDELVVRSLRTWEALELELCKGGGEQNKSNHEDGEWGACRKQPVLSL